MLELLDNPEPINSSLREAALNHRKLAGDFNKSCPISMCKPCFSSISGRRSSRKSGEPYLDNKLRTLEETVLSASSVGLSNK
jgi:Holliday junction resolvase RusA-like endonuclease